MRQADGTDRHIRRPQLRSDLIGGEESMESFWALMSVIIDLVIEHVAHQVLTGTPFSPESETEVFLAKIAAKPRFRMYFSVQTNTDIMLYFALSALPALGKDGHHPAELWDFDISTVFKNCNAAWVAGQIYSFVSRIVVNAHGSSNSFLFVQASSVYYGLGKPHDDGGQACGPRRRNLRHRAPTSTQQRPHHASRRENALRRAASQTDPIPAYR